MIKHITLIAMAAGFLFSCAEFPESYENVIQDQKIRPFAIILDPPEAAPGDTVAVYLKMYDAGKPYTIEWSLYLDYAVDNYSTLSGSNTKINLDSARLPLMGGSGDDPLNFRFVVPIGARNPILLSPIVPELLIPRNELAGYKNLFESQGIQPGPKGLTKKNFVDFLKNKTVIDGNLEPFVDEMVALIQLEAKIKSTNNFELDVVKKLSVRYSNRLASPELSNVNANPAIKKIGIITVEKPGLKDPEKIGRYTSDTTYFSAPSATPGSVPAAVDTFLIKKDASYFLIADSSGAAQKYRSPKGIRHDEQLFYEWFYTNLDETDSEWEELIEIGADESETSLPVVYLKTPKNKNMGNFIIRATVGDWRPEWAFLSPAGLGYIEARGFFKYAD